MKISVSHGDLLSIHKDVAVLPLFEGEEALTGVALRVDKALGGLISALRKKGEFTGKEGTTSLLHVPPGTEGLAPERVMLLGLGKRERFGAEPLRKAGGTAAKGVRALSLKSFSAELPPSDEPSPEAKAQAFTEGVLLGLYRLDAYKTEGREELKKVESLELVTPSKAEVGKLRRGLKQGRVLAEATNFARDLVNHPGNVTTPTRLAEEARRMARRHGLRCRVLGPRDIARLKMGALESVARGSREPARFIILEHRGKRAGDTVCLVGKGITFDTGGISLKPSRDLDKMKTDMGGAAAVLGAMRAAAELSLPVNLVGLVPATENMPGGRATRPGDIVRSMVGLTIEIQNTDAEGRLILCDALAYARRYKPAAVIDLATLTGSCAVALGEVCSGLLGNNEELIRRMKDAGEASGERLWQLPLWEDYYEMIKSDIADIKNVGGRYGGAITAAAFLGKYTESYPWAHVDIAATAWTDKEKPYTPKGATGVGVRLLLELLSRWQKLRPEKKKS
ncbi:MAG: leucyl aminopeptidase [Nitrospinota bacterium]